MTVRVETVPLLLLWIHEIPQKNIFCFRNFLRCKWLSFPFPGTIIVQVYLCFTRHSWFRWSQPGVGTQYAHVGYPGVELVSRATYISRKKRNLETVQRHSKALKKAQRDAKRTQPEISHEAAELIFRNQAARTDEKSPGHTRQQPSRHAAWARERVFLYTVWCRQRWWSFEASEVSVRRIWRIPSESETQAWAWFNAKRTCYGRCKARILVCAVFPFDVAGRLPCIVNVTCHQNKKVSIPPCPSDKLGFVMKKSFGFTFLHDTRSQSMENWLCTGRSSKVFGSPLWFPKTLISLGVFYQVSGTLSFNLT